MRIKKVEESKLVEGHVIDSLEVGSSTNAPSIDAVNGALGAILWTNDNPTSEFIAQTITLNDNITNYKYYEILFLESNTSTRMHSTGKISTSYSARLNYAIGNNHARGVTNNKDNTISFSDGQTYATYGSDATTNNLYCIPYQVIGYK